MESSSTAWLILRLSHPLAPLWLFLVCLSSLLLLYYLLSYMLQRRLWLSEIPLAVGLGIGLGFALGMQPHASSLEHFQTDSGSQEITLRTGTTVAIAVQLTSSGLHASSAFLRQRAHWLSLFTLLVPVLLAMTLISSALLYLFFPHPVLPSYWHCFTLAAAMSPTDPVIASALMRGRFAQEHLSPHVRAVLSLESAINDGVAVLLVQLGLLMSRPHASAQTALVDWIAEALAWKCIMPIVVGGALGAAASHALHASFGHRLCDKEVLLPFSTALTGSLLGSFELLGSNAFLAIMAAATAISWRGMQVGAADHVAGEARMREVADSLDLVVSVAFFCSVGAFFGFGVWSRCGLGRLVGWALCTHVTRRMPAVLLAYQLGGLPSLVSGAEALFVGWFAPIGSASVYYALLVAEEWQKDGAEAANAGAGDDTGVPLWTFAFQLTLFGVASSVLLHGWLGPAAAALLRRTQDISEREAAEERKQQEADGKDEAASDAAAAQDN